MEKTKLELLREAASLLSEIARGEVSGGCLSTEVLPEKLIEHSRQWLQEELSDSDSSESPSDEPPTDDRWFAAYLKGLEAWGRVWAGSGLNAPLELREAWCVGVADRALAAARAQAKESACQTNSN